MTTRSLTARGVKQTLTRAGINWRRLTIAEKKTTARCWGASDNGFGQWETYTEVRLSGPQSLRKEAENALFVAGLACAGYPEYSLWSRPRRSRQP